MNITRRNFMRLSGMAALSAALSGPAGKVFGQAFSDDGLYRVPVESTNDPLNYLIKAHFEPFVGTTLRAGIEGGRPVILRLKTVTGLTCPANEKLGYAGESFSLLFENTAARRLPAGSYVFDHDTLGRFTLMLSPVEKGGKHYEAVINRIAR